MAPPIAVLDVDGTLVDTNYHHAIAWYRAFRQHELTLPVWRIHRHIGMGGDQLVAALAGQRVEDRQGDSIRASETALYADLIGEVVVTNTLPLPQDQQLDKIRVLSVAGIVADAIRAVFEDASVSEIFNDQNQL
jgi:beta-phosphoglucomutase-like phosphatase (HAD superfamily)